MSNNNDSGGFEFFKGFLFGGIVGAVVSLLYAPKSGKEVREDIRKRSLDLRDDAEAKLELAQKRAEEVMADTRKQLEELRKDAESAVQELKSRATGFYEEGKSTVEKERNRIKDAFDAGVNAYKEEKSGKSSKSKK